MRFMEIEDLYSEVVTNLSLDHRLFRVQTSFSPKV